jgi:hypothetical protein
VRKCSWKSAAVCASSSSAFQTRRISSAVSTRSRARSAAGRSMRAHGDAATMSRATAKFQTVRSGASTRLACAGIRSASCSRWFRMSRRVIGDVPDVGAGRLAACRVEAAQPRRERRDEGVRSGELRRAEGRCPRWMGRAAGIDHRWPAPAFPAAGDARRPSASNRAPSRSYLRADPLITRPISKPTDRGFQMITTWRVGRFDGFGRRSPCLTPDRHHQPRQGNRPAHLRRPCPAVGNTSGPSSATSPRRSRRPPCVLRPALEVVALEQLALERREGDLAKCVVIRVAHGAH